MKIVVTILKRTYVQILTVSSNKYKKTSHCPTVLHQVQCSKGTKNRDRHTLSSILRPKGTIVFRALLQYSSLLRGSDGSVLSINVIEASLKNNYGCCCKNAQSLVACMFHHVDVSYNYFFNCSV